VNIFEKYTFSVGDLVSIKKHNENLWIITDIIKPNEIIPRTNGRINEREHNVHIIFGPNFLYQYDYVRIYRKSLVFNILFHKFALYKA
jgi:hypothetical protein